MEIIRFISVLFRMTEPSVGIFPKDEKEEGKVGLIETQVNRLKDLDYL